MLAELDVPKLARSTPQHYSSVLVRHIAPEAASTVAATCVRHSDLEMELTRAGFEGVMTDRIDFARALFADRAAQAAAVAEGLWRGTEGLAEGERSDLAAAVLRLADTGVVVDREPWVLVRGLRRE